MPDFKQSNTSSQNSNSSFVSQILQKLPYVAGAITTDVSNDKYELFDRLAKRQELKIMQQSVITGPHMRDSEYYNPGSFVSDHAYHK